MLAVSELSVFYGDAQALDRVSLSVGTGEIVALVGANGAGKTSLIRTVAGILKPRGGTIEFDGVAIGGLDSHRVCDLGVGQVAEGRQVFPSMTVLENLQVGGLLPRARGQAGETLERVFRMFPRLKERAGQVAGTLSGGEQQMLAIGRALMAQPALLLLDEPSLGLAPMVVENIFEIIQQINAEGTTVMLVEQNAQMALSIAHRGYVLATGEVIMQGTAKELLDDPKVRKAYLGED